MSAQKWLRCYLTDVRASLRLGDRDSRGRFVAGNKYRFARRVIVVAGIAVPVVSQHPLVGDFFRYAGKRPVIISSLTGERI